MLTVLHIEVSLRFSDWIFFFTVGLHGLIQVVFKKIKLLLSDRSAAAILLL